MKSLLLPNKFKKRGVYLFLSGFILWCGVQLGLLHPLLQATTNPQLLKSVLLITAFFSALSGFYAAIFSKEKVEDEFIEALRLRSFQLSSICQFFYFSFSFLAMLLCKLEPRGDGGMLNIVLVGVLVYWLVYISYFHFCLIKNSVGTHEE
jgi:hypothetical protein